jgi:hypothetical protein
MYQLRLIAATAAVFLLCAGGAVAGGPPVVNETVHFLDATNMDVGDNCATGSTDSTRYVTFSGVMRTLAFADGSYRVRGSFRGDTVFFDNDGDNVADATAHFKFAFGDMVLPSGNALYSEVWNGTTTALATGTKFRFHVTWKLGLDPEGNVKVMVFRVTCV